ncbi:uncharacterized protein [Euwallacea similis]|uniref:uncharacterized protein n=1 Tax=Euwallacea similis TaxID=1736056 RepID=UPI00344D0E6B
MKGALVLLLMICCGLTHHQITGDDANDDMTTLEKIAKIIRILIKEYIPLFKDLIIMKKANWNLTISNISAGYLDHSNLILYGLDGLIVNPNKTDLLRLEYDDDLKVFTIGSNISIPQKVGIKLEKYDLDWAIINKIPLFGEGNLTFNLHSIKTGFYMNISFADGFKVDYLEIRPHMSAIKFFVTGFWKVPELNTFLSTLTSIFANFFVIFWELELDLITCLISRLLEFFLNHEKDIFAYVIQNCSKNAANSSYLFIEPLFNGNQTDLLEYISEANALKYAHIASEFLEKAMEDYLMMS